MCPPLLRVKTVIFAPPEGAVAFRPRTRIPKERGFSRGLFVHPGTDSSGISINLDATLRPGLKALFLCSLLRRLKASAPSKRAMTKNVTSDFEGISASGNVGREQRIGRGPGFLFCAHGSCSAFILLQQINNGISVSSPRIHIRLSAKSVLSCL